MPESGPAEHFGSFSTQRHAARLGMWLFLVTELLLFGALFATYASYYHPYESDFRIAARHNTIWAASINTYVLVTSSFTSVMAVWAMREDRRKLAVKLVWLTIALGVLFLGIKAWEYLDHFEHGIYPGRFYRFEELMTRGGVLFYSHYYLLTGLHILHLGVGIGVMLWLVRKLSRRQLTARYHAPLELGAMYWSLVDVIWLFIWPLFYLVR